MASPSKFAHVVFNTHRYEEMIAFLNLGPAPKGLPPRKRDAVGVNHLAHTWRTLGELVDLYERLKADLEFQIDGLEAEAAKRFMRGPAFEATPTDQAPVPLAVP